MNPTTTLPSVSAPRGTHGIEELRRARRELDLLLRALSHDMNANFMLLEDSFRRLRRALGEAPIEDLHQLADHVEACLGQSRGFLDDLVQLGKTGSVEMEPQRVELSGVVEEVLFELHPQLDRHGIIVSSQQPLPAVWCNRQRVKQILTNLLGNAIRHGCDPRSPRISIRATANLADERAGVVLRVHDNGAGIDPADAEEAFLPGRRLATAREAGSGMGLAIVRKIAEHYEGTAWIDLDDSPGTTICVRLPGGPVGAAPRHPNVASQGDSKRDSHPPYRPHARRQGRRPLTRP